MDITNIFKNKKYNKTKLINYGFSAEADNYVLRTYINNKDFLLEIIINKDGAVTSKVTDIDVQEEYTLHLAEIANGNFINKIKQEYNNVIHDILINCFDRDECVFTESISKKIIKYVKDKYGDDLEFLWKKYDKNAVLRRKDTYKWYAAIMTIEKNKLGFASDKKVEIIDLRTNYNDVEKLIMKKGFFPAYHMNKKHWITIILDGTVEFSEISKAIDISYKLAVK